MANAARNARQIRLGKLIRTLREEHGLTQAELAEAAGYSSRESIVAIEKGRAGIPLDRIEGFADAFQMAPERLASRCLQAMAGQKLASLKEPSRGSIPPQIWTRLVSRKWKTRLWKKIVVAIGDEEYLTQLESRNR